MGMAYQPAMAAEGPSAGDQAEMAEEQKAVQARMEEFMTPNANHAVLKEYEGKWKAQVKFWMDPAGDPEISEGTVDAQMIMDGRFLEQKFNGTMMGQPYEGRGLYGYDNQRKEFTVLWFDSFSTGIMTGTAKYDPSTKIMTEDGSMSCPITNEAHRKYRASTTWKDVDTYVYESYMKDTEGKEFKGMEITYTRMK